MFPFRKAGTDPALALAILISLGALLGVACQGAQGTEGSRGASGEAGPTGQTGAPGEPGPAGLIGPSGPAGARGETGPPGIQGSPGAAGARGARGPAGSSAPAPNFILQLLHASDIDGGTGALSNVENFSAILDGFRRQFPDNTLVVSSGDNYIPGRRFAAATNADEVVPGLSSEGHGNIALLNAMGFQASAVGNHELDRGTGFFGELISHQEEGGYSGAKFPYLSSNLVFADDQNLAHLVVDDGQEAFLASGSLAGSTVVTVGGQRIGIVGATTPFLANITISGGITVMPRDIDAIDELATIIQEDVDSLTAQGIDKVILLAHMQQISIEQELASLLEDVDIIVAGGSNTLLADETDRLWPGDESKGGYPLEYQTGNGDPVLLVNTEADFKYLGRLVVEFDGDGLVVPGSVDPHLSGAYATNPQGGHRYAGHPLPEVSRIVAFLQTELKALDGNVFGRTEVFLNGLRGSVRTEETNLGSLAAEANLWTARMVDSEVAMSLKNGGGIRDNIGLVHQPPGTNNPALVQYLPPQANPAVGKEAGAVSQFDIEGALRFNNGLAILELTAAQLRQLMEHAVGFDGVGQVTSGRFPQVAGMRFSFDPNGPVGERIRSLAIVSDAGEITDRVIQEGEVAGDPDRTIKIVTLGFLADGGDGYPFPSPAPGRVDLTEALAGNGPGLAAFTDPGTEQDALAEYLAAHFSETPFSQADTPPERDRRVQNLGIPGVADTVFGEHDR